MIVNMYLFQCMKEDIALYFKLELLPIQVCPLHIFVLNSHSAFV